jgi:hypothetical protein
MWRVTGAYLRLLGMLDKLGLLGAKIVPDCAQTENKLLQVCGVAASLLERRPHCIAARAAVTSPLTEGPLISQPGGRMTHSFHAGDDGHFGTFGNFGLVSRWLVYAHLQARTAG